VTRDELYARINSRFLAMLDEGLLDEVRALQARGDLDPGLPSMRAVGYRQILAHLRGEWTLGQAIAEAQQATRNLAKRQLTWLRREADVSWVESFSHQSLAPLRSALDNAVTVLG